MHLFLFIVFSFFNIDEFLVEYRHHLFIYLGAHLCFLEILRTSFQLFEKFLAISGTLLGSAIVFMQDASFQVFFGRAIITIFLSIKKNESWTTASSYGFLFRLILLSFLVFLNLLIFNSLIFFILLFLFLNFLLLLF